jgi:hypothetical protein
MFRVAVAGVSSGAMRTTKPRVAPGGHWGEDSIRACSSSISHEPIVIVLNWIFRNWSRPKTSRPHIFCPRMNKEPAVQTLVPAVNQSHRSRSIMPWETTRKLDPGLSFKADRSAKKALVVTQRSRYRPTGAKRRRTSMPVSAAPSGVTAQMGSFTDRNSTASNPLVAWSLPTQNRQAYIRLFSHGPRRRTP